MYEGENITLHAVDLAIDHDKVAVTETSGENVKVENIEYEVEREFFIIHLNERLMPGKSYMVTIEYSGEIKNNTRGLYWSYYKEEKTNMTEYLIATHFQATHARRAFPCFDEPGIKANFKVKKLNLLTFSSFCFT